MVKHTGTYKVGDTSLSGKRILTIPLRAMASVGERNIQLRVRHNGGPKRAESRGCSDKEKRRAVPPQPLLLEVTKWLPSGSF